MPLPDESARAAILGVHLRRVPLASQHERELACEAVAKITSGGWPGGCVRCCTVEQQRSIRQGDVSFSLATSTLHDIC